MVELIRKYLHQSFSPWSLPDSSVYIFQDLNHSWNHRFLKLYVKMKAKKAKRASRKSQTLCLLLIFSTLKAYQFNQKLNSKKLNHSASKRNFQIENWMPTKFTKRDQSWFPFSLVHPAHLKKVFVKRFNLFPFQFISFVVSFFLYKIFTIIWKIDKKCSFYNLFDIFSVRGRGGLMVAALGRGS